MALINGTPGNDKLKGTSKADIIDGFAGNDTIRAEGGNDLVYGSAGNDSVYGGAGNDDLNGNEGGEEFYLHGGDDKLYGENGNDRLSGWRGNDFLTGGPGNDHLNGYEDNDTLVGGKGSDILYGADGRDSMEGGSGNDVFVVGYQNVLDEESTDPGFDLIEDFQKGDRIELFVFDQSGDDKPVEVTGFASIDSNGNGKLDGNDDGVDVKKVSFGGASKSSLVIDVDEVIDPQFEYDSYGQPGQGELVVFGVTSLGSTAFANTDYYYG